MDLSDYALYNFKNTGRNLSSIRNLADALANGMEDDQI